VNRICDLPSGRLELHEMSTARAINRFSIGEYLAREALALTKSEYFNGEIVSMAGATIPHNLITTNLISHLHALLRGSGCRPFGSDLRINVEEATSFLYPDVTVICGDVVPAKDDPHSAINPRVIFEVLSETTEGKDRGRKLKLYLKLESLREYVLVAQDEARVDRSFRRDDGTWTMSMVEGPKDWLELESIDCRLAMAEIYDGVKFEQMQT
jgi:Uma2 family endonuclease